MNPLIIAASEKRRKLNLHPLLLGKKLLKGDMSHGYYGEFSANEVISGETLAAMVGLTGQGSGTQINSTAGWLGFALDGKRLLVAKRPIRHSVSNDRLMNHDLRYGEIHLLGENQFLIRNMKGIGPNARSFSTGNDTAITHGSEWNRLMYHVAGRGVLTSEGIEAGDFAQFRDTELGVGYDDLGRRSWCQEQIVPGGGYIVFRGDRASISYAGEQLSNSASSSMGWRPVLELVE